jgi:hypothetical protein
VAEQPPSRETHPLYLRGGTAPLVPVARKETPNKWGDHFVRTRPLQAGAEPHKLAGFAAWEAFKRDAAELQATFDALSGVLAPRINWLRYILQVMPLPSARQQAAYKSLQPNQRPMIQAAVEEALRDASLEGRMRQGVERFDDASAGLRDVADLVSAHTATPPHEALEASSAISLPRLKGKLYHLATLNLLFQDDVVMSCLFPRLDLTPRSATGARRTGSLGSGVLGVVRHF